MKLLVTGVCLFVFNTAVVFALPFRPVVLTINGPEEIAYAFNGKPLEIPVTLTGKPAAIWLVIGTRDLAENIVNVRNGYLGWRYVNKIDTTIYISARFNKLPGN